MSLINVEKFGDLMLASASMLVESLKTKDSVVASLFPFVFFCLFGVRVKIIFFSGFRAYPTSSPGV